MITWNKHFYEILVNFEADPVFIFFKAAIALVYNIYIIIIFIFYISIDISCLICVSMLRNL